MGRSSREQAERNRQRIVETACHLFRQHGVENVSIADIMGAAGLTVGGFYRHFASKEALLTEAFALAFQQSAQSWDAVRDRGRHPPSQRLRALVKRYFKHRPPELSCPMLALASEVSTSSAATPAAGIYRQGVEALFAHFREEARVASPGATDQAVDANALLLFAAMLGTGMLGRALGDTAWTRSMQTAVLDAMPKT